MQVILLNIAIILGPVTGRGGMETVITNVIREYNHRSTDTMKVFILGHSDDKKWLSRINKNNYYLLENEKESKFKRYIKCGSTVVKELRKFNPEVILAADENAVLYSKLVSFRLEKKPAVISWIHFSLTSIKPIYRKILKISDCHLAISDGIKNELLSYNIADKESVYLVYNPISLDNQFIKKSKDYFHFIYMGRIQYNGQKRVNDLLQALSIVTGNWKLSVIGDGIDKNELIDMAEGLNINHQIEWFGWQEAPWSCITEATSLILTSEYEGFPMVLLEAMSRGIPCISSDCPVGPANIIQDGKNGWLFEVGNQKELANILNGIIEGEINLPDQVQIKASIEKYNVKTFIENLKYILNTKVHKD